MSAISLILQACRFYAVIVFASALIGKLLSFDEFRRTVSEWFPRVKSIAAPAAALFLACEAVVLLGLVAAGAWLRLAFAVATMLLLSLALLIGALLARRKVVSCGCFGRHTRQLGGWDLARNLLMVAVMNAGALFADRQTPIPATDNILLGELALIFALLSTHMAEIASIFRGLPSHDDS